MFLFELLCDCNLLNLLFFFHLDKHKVAKQPRNNKTIQVDTRSKTLKQNTAVLKTKVSMICMCYSTGYLVYKYFIKWKLTSSYG